MQPVLLGRLDALRGIAALVVVFDHSSYAFMPEFRRELMPEFNTSRYGIMVFFLVSGYIIPASLERRGSVRTFWIGRVFRMYPLWAATVTAVLALNLMGITEIRVDLRMGGRHDAAVGDPRPRTPPMAERRTDPDHDARDRPHPRPVRGPEPHPCCSDH